jgi:two-component system, OmpR family, KDP operon response regulator KdpE
MREPRQHVFVAPHEPHIRRFLRTYLRAQGYRVLEAATGQEAIARVTTKRPQMVLLDLVLPDVDGLEVLRHIRTWCTAPIVMIADCERTPEKIASPSISPIRPSG